MKAIGQTRAKPTWWFSNVGTYRFVVYGVNVTLLMSVVSFMEGQRQNYKSTTERMNRYHLTTVAEAIAVREHLHVVEDAIVARALEARPPTAISSREPLLVAYPRIGTVLYLVEANIEKITTAQSVFHDSNFEELAARSKRQFSDLRANISDGLTQPSKVESAKRQLAGLALTVEQLRRLHTMEYDKLATALPLNNNRHVQLVIAIVTTLLAVSFVFTRQIFKMIERATDALSRSEERYRTLLESAPNAIVIVDSDARIVLVNSQAELMFGYRREDFIGQPVEMLIPLRYHDRHRQKRQKYLQQPVLRPMGEQLDLCGCRKDGSEFPVEVTLGPIETEEGIFVESTIHDITVRKNLEQEAAEYRDTLSHVSRISTMGEMATGIAHELNQPLTAIAAYSFTAKGLAEQVTECPHELREILEKLEDQAIRAGDIVQRLRKFATKTDSVRTITDLNALVGDVAKFVEPDSRKAETVLTLEFDEPSPKVMVDEIQVQQVLVNLIRNAIDAMQETPTSRREITISTRALQNGQAEVTVSDVGKGLSNDELEHVFDAFYSTKQGGMGLGMRISRTIVEAHGGTLWAKPNNGAGVTFAFTVPLENSHEQ
ncbi:MAG: PAS domain S-box protein [Planctomycetaceae bacterium]|nr:PAS domain S-box protein [Planctomycetaceae bacterium]MBT6486708.1 PAS domain S-box protein [Planctomycetaceae bacterium]MBT6494061.1 PAS domain S-box protein [Planctomycetaceae bacterium]